MRISDLSRLSGVPLPTIKFYLRERLLPPGTPTARNQADYGDEHLDRLRLIRIFVEIGSVNLAGVRTILDAIDDPQLPLHDLCRVVHRTLHTKQTFGEIASAPTAARERVDEFIDGLGWQVDADAPGRDAMAHVLAALQRLGWDCDAEIFAPYVAAAEQLASHELEAVSETASRAEAAATVVMGTILFESALLALRRMAEEHFSAVRFGGTAIRSPR